MQTSTLILSGKDKEATKYNRNNTQETNKKPSCSVKCCVDFQFVRSTLLCCVTAEGQFSLPLHANVYALFCFTKQNVKLSVLSVTEEY